MKEQDISTSPDDEEPESSETPADLFPEWRHHPRKRAFLIAYSRTGTKSSAGAAAGVPHRTYMDWQRDDPAFRDALHIAYDQFGDRIVDGISELAFVGQKVYDYSRGELVGSHYEKDRDALLALARAYRPQQFGTAGQRETVQMTTKQIEDAMTPALAAAILRLREQPQQLPATTTKVDEARENDKEGALREPLGGRIVDDDAVA